jgi:hypothetical protein
VKPEWECVVWDRPNKEEREYLEKLTLKELLLDDNAALAANEEFQIQVNSDKFIEIAQRLHKEKRRRASLDYCVVATVRAIVEAKKEDGRADTARRRAARAELYELIGNDLELHRVALREFTRLHTPGHREGDQLKYPPEVRAIFEAAVLDISRIYAIWERELGKRNRSHLNPPTALGIAARLWGLKVKALRSFRKDFAG